MIYFAVLGTSCFDVYQLINICIPTLTKEVVKQSQTKSVKSFVQTAFAKLDEAGKTVLAMLGIAPAEQFALRVA